MNLNVCSETDTFCEKRLKLLRQKQRHVNTEDRTRREPPPPRNASAAIPQIDKSRDTAAPMVYAARYEEADAIDLRVTSSS